MNELPPISHVQEIGGGSVPKKCELRPKSWTA